MSIADLSSKSLSIKQAPWFKKVVMFWMFFRDTAKWSGVRSSSFLFFTWTPCVISICTIWSFPPTTAECKGELSQSSSTSTFPPCIRMNWTQFTNPFRQAVYMKAHFSGPWVGSIDGHSRRLQVRENLCWIVFHESRWHKTPEWKLQKKILLFCVFNSFTLMHLQATLKQFGTSCVRELIQKWESFTTRRRAFWGNCFCMRILESVTNVWEA